MLGLKKKNLPFKQKKKIQLQMKQKCYIIFKYFCVKYKILATNKLKSQSSTLAVVHGQWKLIRTSEFCQIFSIESI
jgi:hypothetical protein